MTTVRTKQWVSLTAAALLLLMGGVAGGAEDVPTVATFSIVGFDPDSGDLGIAVQSKFFAVGSVVPWARAGVGAIATQAFANTTYGPQGLAMLAQGKTASEVLAALLEEDEGAASRQVGIVDVQGRTAAHTGETCQPWAGHIAGENFTAQGNILVSEATVQAMADAFRGTAGSLGDRLMRALEEGQAAGGDSRGKQSAALLIVRAQAGYGGFDDRYCDLRVDDNADPIQELRRIYDMWNGWALVREGYTLCEEERWDEAFAAGEGAVALHPEDGEPYFHLACYRSRAGHGEKALALLAEAVRLQPDLKARARTDTDLQPLWEKAEFVRITAP